MTVPYYSTIPLERGAQGYRRAIVVMHGTHRDADGYFNTMVELTQAAGALPFTVVVAPRFQTAPDRQCSGITDSPPAGDLYWSCGGWKHGSAALNDSSADSYQAFDAIVDLIKRGFPGLERITVAGHSAGGQLVQRYAAANTVENTEPHVPVRYLVANPSSYLYFDPRRLTKSAACTDATHCDLTAASFAAPYYDAAACPGYDEYPYGMQKRDGYTAKLPDLQIQGQYVARSVEQLNGELDSAATDVAAYSDLDVTCEGNAEGPFGQSFRLQRGLAYNAYARLLGAQHPLQVVPGCGHSQDCMFSSSQAQARLFGN